MRRGAWRKVLHIAGVGAILATATYALVDVIPVNATTAGFAYLLIILFVAAKWGLTEAIIGSIASVLCFNFYFLPPVRTFTIEDPQNWVALFSLLVTAITASRLSESARRQAQEAHERRQEIEQLYALSRSILLLDSTMPVAPQLVRQVVQTIGAEAVALYDAASGQSYRAGDESFAPDLEQLKAAAAGADTAAVDRTWFSPVRLGGKPVGSLAVRGAEISDSARQSLTNLVATGIERARTQEAESRAEAARESDELKSTLLDAIAHEFKTPLTTIKASTSALLSGNRNSPEREREYIALVDEEADRLSGLVSEAIQMARIESGQVRVEAEETQAGDLIASVLEKMKSRIDDRRIEVEIPRELPAIAVDREMMEMGLRQLMDNALKYSPANTPISISVRSESDRVVLCVRDQGPGIPMAEQERIFGKFYRGKDQRSKVAGAGLGLALTKAVVAAHGGEVWTESKPGAGAAFFVALRAAGAESGDAR